VAFLERPPGGVNLAKKIYRTWPKADLLLFIPILDSLNIKELLNC